jgi:CRISPR system Cascade subunit CasD
MRDFLMLRLEGPLQAWGDVAFDASRPTRSFPSTSGLAGLLGNALGLTRRQGQELTALQDSLFYAVREDRRPGILRDFQTYANLGQQRGWTSWGIEKPKMGNGDQAHVMVKYYLEDGSLLVALGLRDGAGVTLTELAEALKYPAGPLFLGRKSCPPSQPLYEGRQKARSPLDALRRWPRGDEARPRCWYDPEHEGGIAGPEGLSQEVWDRRDYTTGRFVGSRRIVESVLEPIHEGETQ